MKILIYGMSEQRGGVETFIYNFYSNFSDDVQCDFVTDFASIPFEDEFVSKGSRIFKLPSRRKNLIAYNKYLDRLFTENKYDIVWANVCTLSSIGVLSYAKKYGVPVRIVHSHNSENMGGKVTALLHGMNLKKIKNVATDFWACSPEAGEWMFGEVIETEKVKVIRNAIDLDKFSYSLDVRQQVRNELNVDNEFVIGHVGRFHPQKNQKFLLDIFKEIVALKDNSRLVMVGSGSLQEEIESYAKELNVYDKVLWLGQRSDVERLLQGFDVFLLPSAYEGLPFVLVESQAAALPSYTTLGKVSKESKISDCLEFVDLNLGAKHWATLIVNNADLPRENNTEALRATGFDIVTESRDIEKFLKMRVDSKNDDKK